MNQTKLLLFTTIIILFASCRQDVFPEIEESSQEIVVIAEIEEGVSPEITVSTTFEVNSAPYPLNESNTFLNVGDPIVLGGDYVNRGFRSDGIDTNVFFFPDPDGFKPKPGLTYTLNVKTPTLEYEEINSETTMPFPGDFTNIPTVQMVSENSEYSEFQVTAELAAPPNLESYYHLIPYFTANDGSLIYPNVNTIDSGLNASFVLTHRSGMLVDYSKIDDSNPLSFTLRTILPLDIDQLNDRNMYFKLCTVTDDYYEYHKSVSRIYETDKSPFTLPVLSYTQFDNGYGIFTAFSAITKKAVIE